MKDAVTSFTGSPGRRGPSAPGVRSARREDAPDCLAASTPDPELVVEQIRSIIGSPDPTPRTRLRWQVAVPAIAAMLAIAVFLGWRPPVAKVAPVPSPEVVAIERPRPVDADRKVAVPVATTSPVPVASPSPRAYHAAVPRRAPPTAPSRAVAVVRPGGTPTPPPASEGVDGGNGAVAVHLTGKALRVALEKDAALTKRLNEAELRRGDATTPES